MKRLYNIVGMLQTLPEGMRRLVAGSMLVVAGLFLVSVWSVKLSSSFDEVSPGAIRIGDEPLVPVSGGTEKDRAASASLPDELKELMPPDAAFSPAAGVLESIKSAETLLQSGITERIFKTIPSASDRHFITDAMKSVGALPEKFIKSIRNVPTFLYKHGAREVKP